MNNLFLYIKDSLLHGMPSGMLVTKDKIEFDIGMWQHKTYDDNSKIRDVLRGKWCSTIINILFLDSSITELELIKFMDEINFQTYGRNILLPYCLVIKTTSISQNIIDLLSNNTLSINRFTISIVVGEYTIFINDFIKNILYL